MSDDTLPPRPLEPSAIAREAHEDAPTNPSGNPTLGDMIALRFGRRDLLKGLLGVAAMGATLAPRAMESALAAPAPQGGTASDRFAFPELTAAPDETIHVAQGHEAHVLVRWGDPVLPGAPVFDPQAQTPAAQAMQFGYNNDFVGFLPDPQGRPDRGLLVVNHEYTNPELMFPGIGPQRVKNGFPGMTRERVDIEMAAHGGSVIGIVREGGRWRLAPVPQARRITATTPMLLSGPAAGDDLLKTQDDPEGRNVLGMINNCAGGMTPWGTWLTCEENFNLYFMGKAEGHARERAFKRYGIPAGFFAWGRYHDRFDIAKVPNEANRFGWVVEIDPLDPASVPRKRTALGRFKHEGAGNVVNGDGRFVIYQGDDQKMDYVYRFVTARPYDPVNRAANRDLLDEGTLSVAVFHPDGTGEWRPLTFGTAPLVPENGFTSQAQVLIETRLAADALRATKMDRPEDVEVNPRTGKVYVMLTSNDTRKEDETNAANPRAANVFGHIVEITPNGGDHAAPAFTWDILVKCGDPSVAEVGATFSASTSGYGWFANPDNCAVDSQGRLWVATDGNSAKSTGRTDGIWGVETEGDGRATAKRFFSVPVGAEMCGPYFTPDDTTFFVAVQHPGESEDGRLSTFDDPSTRWPDFKDGTPPRPSVVTITRIGGGPVGG